jgi:hypothetical protein
MEEDGNALHETLVSLRPEAVVGEESLDDRFDIRLRLRFLLSVLVNEAPNLLVLLGTEAVVELEAEADFPSSEKSVSRGEEENTEEDNAHLRAVLLAQRLHLVQHRFAEDLVLCQKVGMSFSAKRKRKEGRKRRTSPIMSSRWRTCSSRSCS